MEYTGSGRNSTEKKVREIEKRAPSTQIKKNFSGGNNWGKEKDKNSQNPQRLQKNVTSSLPVPVDFEIQDLIRKSLTEENILKNEDLSWLSWL